MTCHLRPKAENTVVVRKAAGGEFQREGIASTKALRWEIRSPVSGPERRLVWLGCGE